MKSAILLLSCVLGSSGILGAATNILSDSGFDMSTPASQTNPVWNMTANQPNGFSAQYQDAGWASNPVGTPGVGVWMRAFEGSAANGLANATVSQTVAATPGLTYELSVYNRQEANYTAASTFFSVSFLDGAGSVLSTESQDIAKPSDGGIFHNFTLSAVAPASTAQAMVEFGMVDGMDAGANPQSAMFDDVTLTTDVIPEPSSSLFALLGLSGLLIRRRR